MLGLRRGNGPMPSENGREWGDETRGMEVRAGQGNIEKDKGKCEEGEGGKAHGPGQGGEQQKAA